MLGDILLLFRIRMTRKVNGFFYYFKKLPLIGRLLKESCYAAVNLKGVLSVFSFLVDVLKIGRASCRERVYVLV